jgi:hypothetical protein
MIIHQHRPLTTNDHLRDRHRGPLRTTSLFSGFEYVQIATHQGRGWGMERRARKASTDDNNIISRRRLRRFLPQASFFQRFRENTTTLSEIMVKKIFL